MFEMGLIILMFVALGFVGWALSKGNKKPEMSSHQKAIYEEEYARLKARRDFDEGY